MCPYLKHFHQLPIGAQKFSVSYLIFEHKKQTIMSYPDL